MCYAHEDAAEVIAEVERLNAQGHRVWYDEGISPGHQWQEELAKAIDGCAQFLFYVSPRSVQSPYCINEVYYALDASKPMLLVHLRSTHITGGLRLATGATPAIFKSQLETGEYEHALAGALRALDPPAPPASIVRADSRRAARSLAVLPFSNERVDEEIDYLGDGIADELIAELSQVPGLRVISGSSSFRFRDTAGVEAGLKLGAANVLEGRIRKSGDRLRLRAQLVDVHDGTILWSGRYDATLTDLLDLQEDLARQILMALHVYLSSNQHALLSPGTSSVPAYNSYLVGRHERSRLTREGLDRSIASLRQAIAQDPRYVAAYYGLWEALDYKGRRFAEREAAFEEQRGLVRALRELDPHRNQINWAFVDRYMASRGFADLDMDETEQLFRQMFRDGTHLATQRDRRECWFRYGMLLAKAGYFETSARYLEHAEATNPMDEFIKFRLGEIYLALGDTERGLQRLAQASEISPHYLEPLIDVLVFHCQKGSGPAARIAADRIAAVLDADLNRLVEALLAHGERQHQEAAGILDSLEESRSVPPVYKAFCWMMFGDVERAARWLDTAWKQGDEIATEVRLVRTRMAIEDDWQRALRTPAFVAVLEAMGLGEDWCQELGRRARDLASVTGIEHGADARS